MKRLALEGTITINNAPPTVATGASATPSPVTGTTTALTVLGADDGGEGNLTYTWATTGSPPAPVSFSANGTNAAKNSTATFAKAGSYNFVVTISDGANSVMDTVAVTVAQTLTSISVSPASANLPLNGTQAFTATARDQFGDALSSQPSFTWTKTSGIGGIDSSGLYTAPGTTGSATIRATASGISGSASITVNNTVPTVATAASASPSPVTGTSSALSVLGADDGGEANLIYTWVATAKPSGSTPLFSANGNNAAKDSTVTFDRAGSYTFQVTISDGSLSTTSSVAAAVGLALMRRYCAHR